MFCINFDFIIDWLQFIITYLHVGFYDSVLFYLLTQIGNLSEVWRRLNVLVYTVGDDAIGLKCLAA